MGPKNLLILFFSTVAVSLVILIIFFSLFFKNVNLDFNTRLPESAPDIGGAFNQTSTMSPDSKAEGLMRSTVNVPSDSREVDHSGKGGQDIKKDSEEDSPPSDVTLPPISDDALLEEEYPQPLPEKALPPGTVNEKPTSPSDKATTSFNANRPSAPPPPPRSPRPTQEFRRETPPPPQLLPEPDASPMPELDNAGPPVP